VPHRANGISLAITEWGPYFHLEPSSRFVDHVKTLGSALYVGSVLKVFIEDPRVELANAFKLIDNAWMGWIGVRDSAYLAKAPAMAMQMYRQHFGERLVETEVVAPVASSPALGIVDAVAQVPQLECVSSLSNDGETLYLMVINKSFDTAITTRIDLAGFEAGGATVHTLNGTAIDANTGTQLPQIPGVKWARQATASPDGRFHFGRPGEVTIQSAEADLKGARLLCVFPAHSMTAVELRKQPVMRDE
jgi:alpha-N-arabinofuranosidase